MSYTYTDKTYAVRDNKGRYVCRGTHTCGNNTKHIAWWVVQMLEIKGVEPDRQLHDQLLNVMRGK